jgi:molybdate transport system ATP-binding protein
MLDVNVTTHLDTFHLKIDFQVKTSKTLVLLGESGAGKSTVLRLLAGLLFPKVGSILLNNVVYYDSVRRIVLSPQERSCGYVFQDYLLFPHLNVFENVAFGLRAQHLPRQEIRRRVQEILDQVQMLGFEQRCPRQLSGGQQQRVALARALILAPQLLLLDEPLAALDAQTHREIRHELHHLLSQLTVTTVMVTHQYLDALFFGDQILVLDKGRAIQQGDQRSLRDLPRSSYVAELVGVNYFRGCVDRYEANTTYRVHVMPCNDDQVTGATFRPYEIVASLYEQSTATQPLVSGTEVNVLIDPRNITLHRTAPESSARNLFCGKIIHLLHLAGPAEREDGRVRISLALQPGNLPFTAEITEASVTRMGLAVGQYIYATFKASEARVYL